MGIKHAKCYSKVVCFVISMSCRTKAILGEEVCANYVVATTLSDQE